METPIGDLQHGTGTDCSLRWRLDQLNPVILVWPAEMAIPLFSNLRKRWKHLVEHVFLLIAPMREVSPSP